MATKAEKLLAEVEELLEKEEVEDAEAKATEAVDMFKEIKDMKGTAYAMVALVKVWQAKLDCIKYEKRFGWRHDVEDLNQETVEYCETAIEEFVQAKNQWGEGAMHTCLAQTNSIKGKPDLLQKASKSAEKAIDLLTSAKDYKLLMAALMAQSGVLLKQGKTKEATSAAQSAIGHAQSLDDKKAEAQALTLVALAQGYSRNFHGGYITHLEVLKLYRELGDKKAQAIQLYTIAQWQLTRQNPKDAIPTSKEALAIFESLGTGNGWTGAALRMLVTAYLARSEFSNAMRIVTSSIQKFKEQGEKRMLALANDILAYVHLAQQEVVEALEASKTAIELSQGLDDDEWEADMRKTMAQILSKMDDSDKVIENLEASAEIWKKLKNTTKQVQCHCKIGDEYAKMQDEQKFKAAYKQALTIAKDSGSIKDEAFVNYSQASCYDKSASYDDAATKAQAAADLYYKLSNQEGQSQALSIVADCYHRLGDFAKAMIAAKRRMGLAKGGYQLKSAGASMQKVAELYVEQKEYKTAIKIAKMAKEACVKCEDYVGRVLAETCVMKAVCFHLDSDGAPAKDSKDWECMVQVGAIAKADASKFADRMPGSQIKGTVKYWAAHLSYVEGVGYDALEEASEARSLLFESGNMASVGRCSILLGMIYKDLDNKDAAIDMFEDGMSQCTKQGDKAGVAMAKDYLTKLGFYDKPEMPAGVGGAMTPEMMQMMMSMQASGGAPAALADSGPSDEAASAVAVAAPSAVKLTKEQIVPTIMKMVVEVAGSGDALTADVALMDAGIDSLAAVSFRNDLAKAYEIDLPASLMFDYPNVSDLSEHILAVLEGDD